MLSLQYAAGRRDPHPSFVCALSQGIRSNPSAPPRDVLARTAGGPHGSDRSGEHSRPITRHAHEDLHRVRVGASGPNRSCGQSDAWSVATRASAASPTAARGPTSCAMATVGGNRS
jgi:hypothetical protein